MKYQINKMSQSVFKIYSLSPNSFSIAFLFSIYLRHKFIMNSLLHYLLGIVSIKWTHPSFHNLIKYERESLLKNIEKEAPIKICKNDDDNISAR